MNMGNLTVGVGLGMALGFLFDPNLGRRRRALARDKMARATRKTREALDATARDMANRTKGIASGWSHAEEGDADDAVLVERVRAKLGRISSHPRAIDVYASAGEVTLRGPIFASEAERVQSEVARIRGVRSVNNELEPHQTSEGIPALQGHGLAGARFDILQRNWVPTTQALVAAAGVVATGVCLAAYSAQGRAR